MNEQTEMSRWKFQEEESMQVAILNDKEQSSQEDVAAREQPSSVAPALLETTTSSTSALLVSTTAIKPAAIPTRVSLPVITREDRKKQLSLFLRNQVLREQALFDFSFHNAVKLIAKQYGGFRSLWMQRPGGINKTTKIRNVYYLSELDRQLLVPGMLAFEDALEEMAAARPVNKVAWKSSAHQKLADVLTRVCPREAASNPGSTTAIISGGSSSVVTPSLGPFQEECYQMLKEHMDELYASRCTYQEENVRFLYAFLEEVDRCVRSAFPVGRPKKDVDPRNVALRTCTEQLIKCVEDWDDMWVSSGRTRVKLYSYFTHVAIRLLLLHFPSYVYSLCIFHRISSFVVIEIV